MILRGFWQSERGFTLVEVMATIIVMGILAAIAMSVWWPVVEGRRVDSATNQIASELRRAHTSATTRLEDWRVEMDADTRDYRIYRIDPDTGDLILLSSHRLPERTEFQDMPAGFAIVFEPNGEAQVIPPPATPDTDIITVADDDDGAPSHTIKVNPITSRIEVDG